MYLFFIVILKFLGKMNKDNKVKQKIISVILYSFLDAVLSFVIQKTRLKSKHVSFNVSKGLHKTAVVERY